MRERRPMCRRGGVHRRVGHIRWQHAIFEPSRIADVAEHIHGHARRSRQHMLLERRRERLTVSAERAGRYPIHGQDP